MGTAIGVTCVWVALVAVWITWRLSSKRALLPCPAVFAWLVEVENPLARTTRSQRVIQQLMPPQGARVMDIGCGPGRVTIPLARAVGSTGEVIALDVQNEMLTRVATKARREGITNIRLTQSDMGSARIEADSIDAAVMVMVLGEIPSRESVFAGAFAALKPGGRLLVAESVFDPHYVRRPKLRSVAQAAGFVETAFDGNIFGYSICFQKPRAV